MNLKSVPVGKKKVSQALLLLFLIAKKIPDPQLCTFGQQYARRVQCCVENNYYKMCSISITNSLSFFSMTTTSWSAHPGLVIHVTYCTNPSSIHISQHNWPGKDFWTPSIWRPGSYKVSQKRRPIAEIFQVDIFNYFTRSDILVKYEKRASFLGNPVCYL